VLLQNPGVTSYIHSNTRDTQQKNGRTSLITVLRNCRFKFFTDVQERAAGYSENKIKRINVIGRRHVELLMSKLIMFVFRLSLCSVILNKMFT
jgi:hypothetical protein